MKLICDSVSKDFGDYHIFKNISFEIRSGQSLAITGPNGSGKTTLIRILCGLIRPNAGKIEYSNDQGVVSGEEIYHHIGLVGPYLELYEELTAYENMKFFSKLKRVRNFDMTIGSLLKRMRLGGREDDAVKTYSSGMKQRLKYAFALLNSPEILFLDEPTSNLDSEGIDTVYQIMEEQKKDRILIIATNDKTDLKFGDQQIAIS